MGARNTNHNSKIVLGTTEDRKPLSIQLDELREKHWGIVGSTGQRKTLCLTSIFLQLIPQPTDCCIFVDLGGDVAAFWLLKQAAEKADKPFYFFR